MELGRTLLELRTELMTRGYDAIDTATLDAAINSSLYRILGARRWDFMVANTEQVLPVGAESILLATATARRIDGVVLKRSTTDRWQLEYLPLEQFYQRHADEAATGEPEVWSQEGGNILIHPTATVAATLELRYHVGGVKLVATTDRALIPSAYTQVILDGAVKRLAARQRDWNAASTAEADFQAGLKEMRDFYGLQQRQQSARVVASGYYDA